MPKKYLFHLSNLQKSLDYLTFFVSSLIYKLPFASFGSETLIHMRKVNVHVAVHIANLCPINRIGIVLIGNT